MKIRALQFALAIPFALLLGPAYGQTETALSSKKLVIEGLGMSAPFKTAAVEKFNLSGRFPVSNAELTLPELESIKVVSRIEVSSADPATEVTIKIVYGSWAWPMNVLVLHGVGTKGGVRFQCGGEGSTIPEEWRPEACRQPKS